MLRVCGLAGLGFSVVLRRRRVGTGHLPRRPLAIAIAHLGGGAQWTLSTYGLQVRSPDAIRGRVMAGDFAIVTLVMSISSLLAGLMSEAVGRAVDHHDLRRRAGTGEPRLHRRAPQPIVERLRPTSGGRTVAGIGQRARADA